MRMNQASSNLPLDRTLAALAFALGLATILGALGSQYLGGLVPCELCLGQRLPYYIGLPFLALLLLLWRVVPVRGRMLATIVLAALFLWGTYLGAYHAGVEYGWFPGPTSCTGTGGEISFDQLGDIDAARVVPCDKVQFQLFGISLAGFNAIISLAITILLAASAWAQKRRRVA